MANAPHRHLPRIKDATGTNRYRPHIWNGSAWVEHPPYINCDKTNMWLYNNGNENTEITGGWIASGCHFTYGHPGNHVMLGLTKNGNSMTITNNSGAVYDGDSGIVHIANDVDLTPYSTLRFRVDYKMVNSGINLGAMPKGSAYFASHTGSFVALTGVNDVKGADLYVDVSRLTGAYEIFIGIVAWASNNSVTVYEVELR